MSSLICCLIFVAFEIRIILIISTKDLYKSHVLIWVSCFDVLQSVHIINYTLELIKIFAKQILLLAGLYHSCTLIIVIHHACVKKEDFYPITSFWNVYYVVQSSLYTLLYNHVCYIISSIISHQLRTHVEISCTLRHEN